MPKPKDRVTGECLWIIYTGTTHHVTGKFSQLCTAQKIPGCPVGLQDGCSAEATNEGDVILLRNLKLHNILFVHNLDCNLISITQLLDSANCIVQFTKTLCVL